MCVCVINNINQGCAARGSYPDVLYLALAAC